MEERGISFDDLMALQAWVRTGPEAPEGDWYKDFGSFILCGSGRFPKTVLEKGMKPFGGPIDRSRFPAPVADGGAGDFCRLGSHRELAAGFTMVF